MRRGAGAYICGEETALFNSIEGYRGEPRSKPPFPVDVGLFGQPTVANNVETLVNVLPIVLDGGEAFARTGSGMSTGTKLFCVSGHVGRPGVYEVPFGPTLADVIELAGGVGGSGRLQAILLGGVAGRFVGPEALDTPLTFEGARSIGASLGSGVILPLDDTVDLRPLLVRIAGFFRHESCGQCVPCRVGTVRQQEALVRLTKGSDVNRELALIDEVGRCMRDASICGLGQTAYDAVESALRPVPAVRRRECRCLTSRSTATPSPSRVARPCSTPAAPRASTCRRSATARRFTPKNACRICVVELDGSRVLVPACSRQAEDGMVVHTQTDRAQHARKLVLELLASTTELDWAPHVASWIDEYGAAPARFGDDAATVHQPATVDNELYVRDYGRCILCYKCVDACGEQWQNTFAISVAGRGFDAHISTEWDVVAPRLGLRVLRQLHRRVPNRRADAVDRVRDAPRRHLGRGGAGRDHNGLRVLRRRVQPRAARAGQPHREGDEPLRSLDHARQPLHQGPLRLHPRRRRVSATRRCSSRCRGA